MALRVFVARYVPYFGGVPLTVFAVVYRCRLIAVNFVDRLVYLAVVWFLECVRIDRWPSKVFFIIIPSKRGFVGMHMKRSFLCLTWAAVWMHR